MAGAGSTVPFVGLTGGMGAGKSTALAQLSSLGAATISSDAVVHELYEEDPLRSAVLEHFGPEVARNGEIDRAEVARLAFAEPGERAWLESQVWPLVGARVASWLEQARGAVPPPPAAIVEVPLLFEAGMEAIYDATIAVVSDETLRRERAAARGHEAVDERTGRQLSQDDKAQRATYVVHNDGSVEQLRAQLSEVLAKLTR
jgi:dephospho-CoA kinase